eukprot:COSAG01_NODE_2583_length_7421_cov_3.605163_9_plen_44_part_00
MRELSIIWLRAQIGLVAQEPVLFGSATRGSIREVSDTRSPLLN